MATRIPRKPTPPGRVSTRALERRVGHVIGERYELLGLLGAGRQGSVYRAKDLTTGTDVALKILHVQAESSLTERLEREAAALEQLASEGVARLIGRAWDRGRVVCMVTEILDGETFEAVLDGHERRRTYVSLDELRRVVRAVAETLDRAHAFGMIHRDVKPSNIFITETGAVKLIDFGYVKVIDAGTVTGMDVVPGTPAYVAPEVTQDPHIDGRSDLYGLGVVTYRALTGKLPFDGNHPVAILNLALKAERPSIFAHRRDLAPEIDAFNERALAADPRDRFQTGRELADALDYALCLDPNEA